MNLFCLQDGPSELAPGFVPQAAVSGRRTPEPQAVGGVQASAPPTRARAAVPQEPAPRDHARGGHVARPVTSECH